MKIFPKRRWQVILVSPRSGGSFHGGAYRWRWLAAWHARLAEAGGLCRASVSERSEVTSWPAGPRP